METIAWVLKGLLALVFFMAAVGKLSGGVGVGPVFKAAGLPEHAAGLTDTALPWLEIATGALLLLPATAVAGAWLSVALLGAMTLIVGLVLARGKRPPCNCFGASSGDEISTGTLVRNGLLLTAAGMLALPGSMSALLSWQGWAPVSALANGGVIGMCLAGVLLAWLQLHQFKQNGRLMLRVDELELRLSSLGVPSAMAMASPSSGLPVGALAPGFSLPRLDGKSNAGLADILHAGRPLLLIFSDADCRPCTQLLPRIQLWRQAYRDQVEIVLIVHDGAASLEAKPGKYPGDSLIDSGREVARSYQALATPSAVLVDAGGVIQSELGMGEQGIGALLVRLPVHDMPAATIVPVPA